MEDNYSSQEKQEQGAGDADDAGHNQIGNSPNYSIKIRNLNWDLGFEVAEVEGSSAGNKEEDRGQR